MAISTIVPVLKYGAARGAEKVAAGVKEAALAPSATQRGEESPMTALDEKAAARRQAVTEALMRSEAEAQARLNQLQAEQSAQKMADIFSRRS